MRVTFCWPEISGYMAACWRALAAHEGVELFILARRSGVAGAMAAFDSTLVSTLPCRLLEPAERDNFELIASIVEQSRPDVIVLPGWGIAAYMKLASYRALADRRFVIFMDTPRKDNWRQLLARYRLRGYLKRMAAVMVTGERSWQYARQLGIPAANIRRGTYGIDFDGFAPALARRGADPSGWPRRFLFMGRYVDIKGIEPLLRGYEQYRAAVTDPWPLTCHGTGPLQSRIASAAGVDEAGFVQPTQQPEEMARHGVLILPSLYDPWPLAIVEAVAAGLPVICTDACGSAVELVRPYFNGLVAPPGDAPALAAAMRWMHDHADLLPEMGRAGQPLAAAYSAQMWARRWAELCRDITGAA